MTKRPTKTTVKPSERRAARTAAAAPKPVPSGKAISVIAREQTAKARAAPVPPKPPTRGEIRDAAVLKACLLLLDTLPEASRRRVILHLTK